MQDNSFAELPGAALAALTRLRVLHLSRNKLTALPVEIGLLTNLAELYLDNNLLTRLPVELGNLTKLLVLHLYHGDLLSANLRDCHGAAFAFSSKPTPPAPRSNDQLLQALPAEIGRLTQLTTLEAARNALTALPAEIGQLAQLRRLGLQHNRLTVFTFLCGCFGAPHCARYAKQSSGSRA